MGSDEVVRRTEAAMELAIKKRLNFNLVVSKRDSNSNSKLIFGSGRRGSVDNHLQRRGSVDASSNDR